MRPMVAASEGPQDRCDNEKNLSYGSASAGSTGLTEAVLQGIRTDVFNIAVPIGP
jgi:hypothetical protein